MKPDLLLRQIGQALSRALDYTAGLEFADFVAEPRTQDAVLYNLTRLGLAAEAVPAEVRARYPGLEWEAITPLAELFTRLHFGVQDEIVWDLVRDRLPVWRSALEGAQPTEA
jgi:uncharacterized protein with HEPN domain